MALSYALYCLLSLSIELSNKADNRYELLPILILASLLKFNDIFLSSKMSGERSLGDDVILDTCLYC